jgi:23S rRNA (uracil1939-C5)-methyltransferase
VAGGEGLARFAGVPIFVARSAPGDRLRVRLVERRPDYGRAEIVEVLVPGPGRRQPPCPYFARCGGCDLQHLSDALQPRLKAAAAHETLERLSGVELPAEWEVIAGQAWGYRLRTQLHVLLAQGSARGPLGEAGPGPASARVGYHARGSHDLVAVDRCPILVPELEAELAGLAGRLPAEPPRRLDLAAGGDGRVTASPLVPGLPAGEVELAVGRFRYAYDARTFFQAHRGLAAKLVATAVGEWAGAAAYDLYAGVGLFSLPLAERYGRVTAVEGDRVAARFARNNARRNRVTNLEVVTQAVESWVGTLPPGVDRVVVDPPRAGLLRPIRRILLERRPRRLTYVSCHPATLARDVKDLAAAYHVESLTFLDLFPQTGHLETVVQLVAGSRATSAGPGTGPATACSARP